MIYWHLQLLDLHMCPYNRQTSVEAIPTIHAALHELEKATFLLGPEFGKSRNTGIYFSISSHSPTRGDSRRSFSQPCVPSLRSLSSPPLPAMLRYHARLLKDSAASLGSPCPSEDSESFFCGSVNGEEEYEYTVRVTVGTANNTQKIYIIEDLQL